MVSVRTSVFSLSKERQRRANSSLGRSASVISRASRRRSLRLALASTDHSCSQVNTRLSFGRRFLGIFSFRVGSLTRNSCSRASSKIGFQIGPRLLDPVLRVPLRQMVHMRLQHEPIKRIERLAAELVYQVELDLRHLRDRRIRPPIPLPKWEVTVPDKPLEGDGAVFQHPASEVLTSSLRDLGAQRIARLELGHLGPEAELDTDLSDSLCISLRIKYDLSEVAVPLLSAQGYPPCLV